MLHGYVVVHVTWVAVCYVAMWWLMLAGVSVAGRQHLLDMGPLGLYRLHGPEDLDIHYTPPRPKEGVLWTLYTLQSWQTIGTAYFTLLMMKLLCLTLHHMKLPPLHPRQGGARRNPGPDTSGALGTRHKYWTS